MRHVAATLALLAAALAAPPAEATFPYPAPPAGTPPQDYAAYCFLPTTSPPVRPSDFTGGTAWKLTSDQSGDPTIDASPAELFGVTGMSVDLAWQITTGRPDVTIAVLDSGITALAGFPHVSDDLQFFVNPAIGDVSGDGRAEVIAGSGGYLVHAVDTTGQEARGWPKFTGGWTIASPAIGQLGHRRVVAVTTREGDLWVWRIRGKRPAWFWPRARHDTRNTGLFAR